MKVEKIKSYIETIEKMFEDSQTNHIGDYAFKGSTSIANAKDVFLNIAGGIKVEDPSIDLAIVCALLSSYEDVALPQKICFAGEVGLSGEIRAVNRIEQRIAEAEKLGFEKIIVSKYNTKAIQKLKTGIEIVALGKVEEVYQYLF